LGNKRFFCAPNYDFFGQDYIGKWIPSGTGDFFLDSAVDTAGLVAAKFIWLVGSSQIYLAGW